MPNKRKREQNNSRGQTVLSKFFNHKNIGHGSDKSETKEIKTQTITEQTIHEIIQLSDDDTLEEEQHQKKIKKSPSREDQRTTHVSDSNFVTSLRETVDRAKKKLKHFELTDCEERSLHVTSDKTLQESERNKQHSCPLGKQSDSLSVVKRELSLFCNSKHIAKKEKGDIPKAPNPIIVKYTPLEQQFLEFKEQYPDAVLFVECGYKYRFFGDDAMVAGEILKIFTHQDHNFLTASIPVHRLEVHVGRLVAAGYKVGIVSQTETAALKAAGTNRNVPFTRKLTALYTRSTMIGLDSGDLAEENSSVSMVTNYLVCIYDNGSKKGVQEHQLGLVAVQPSTGDVIYDCFLDSGARPELETRLSHIQPVEVLLSTDVSMETENAVKSLQIVSEQGEDKMRVEKLNFERFEQSYSFRKLNSFYKTVQALDFILELPKPVQCCLGALIEYLEDFNLQSTLSDVSLFTKFSTLTETMQLDSRVLHNLEVFVNQTDGSERGSLFSMVNHTQTKAGARLLKTWLAKPLINYSEIMKRQEAVKHLVECDLEETEGWSSALRNLPDLEQKLMSAFLKKIKPADFYNMCVALETVRSEFAKKRSKSQRHVTSHLLSNYLTNVPDLLSDVGHIVESLNGKAAKSFSTCYQRFRQAVRCLAELDCLLSLATVGRQQGYTRPIMVENDLVIDVTKGGHPVVQSLLSETGQYVYNDTHLQAGDRRVMLITGPNMGGKSCYIRQVALFVLLAQMGSYVPAEAARIGVFDGIYTRMGAKDDIFRGQSTFMTELVETSDIMSKVTDRSLVILDELGRGTSTHDGMAIAYAALDHFIKKSQCFLLFVTHYPMLAEFEALFPQTVTNHHMAFYMVANDDSDSEDLSQVVFLYQLVEGKASRSYGLNVARLAGLPQCIVTSARQLSHGMEERELTHRKQVELFQNLMCNPGLDVRHVLGEKKSADLKR